ncbi:unnamed protein product [Meganyctiphanes norvegica]|uniref:Uncharacterized protein n=1 Tax=Meganyctiphanes norvegica TaxID=48144 RepID=A0AAV2QES9_MEGNR
MELSWCHIFPKMLLIKLLPNDLTFSKSMYAERNWKLYCIFALISPKRKPDALKSLTSFMYLLCLAITTGTFTDPCYLVVIFLTNLELIQGDQLQAYLELESIRQPLRLATKCHMRAYGIRFTDAVIRYLHCPYCQSLPTKECCNRSISQLRHRDRVGLVLCTLCIWHLLLGDRFSSPARYLCCESQISQATVTSSVHSNHRNTTGSQHSSHTPPQKLYKQHSVDSVISNRQSLYKQYSVDSVTSNRQSFSKLIVNSNSSEELDMREKE